MWLCVVWGHSLMSGTTSSAESSFVVTLLRPIFTAFGITDMQTMSFLIRKTAHFTEFAILCALGLRMSVEWFGKVRRALLLAIAIWIIAPCVDESIQLLIPERAGMLRDVLIDMSGGVLGMLCMGAWILRTFRSR
ncbi:MAG: VanZ family protein [Atopobiaceae bacterium]|nr:VanZ family protein [Atopobiaceae bacterium]